jgi:predicted transcriptional regulator
VFFFKEQIGGMAMSFSHSIALLPPVELEVLEILWCHSCLSAKELHTVLAARHLVPYRTVKTILILMQAKGLVEKNVLHQPVTYQTVYSKTEFQQFALSQLAKLLFQGDMSRLFRTILTHPGLENTHKTSTGHSLIEPDRQLN